MSTHFYKFAYRVGFTPWEHADLQGPVAEQISAMFDREEKGRQPPYGEALDLGCGTGPHAVALATRGWQVTGIDIVPKALQVAGERARNAGVDLRLIQGDVTALRAAGVGSGFRLVMDFGTVHGLKTPERETVGREVSAVATPDATLLMFTFAPGRRGPIARGMSREDIEATFPGWGVTDEEPYAADIHLPPFVKAPDPRWYRLRRE
jgi:SAM-dependent methyltransferase